MNAQRMSDFGTAYWQGQGAGILLGVALVLIGLVLYGIGWLFWFLGTTLRRCRAWQYESIPTTEVQAGGGERRVCEPIQ